MFSGTIPLFLWWFSIAMLNYQRVNQLWRSYHGRYMLLQHHIKTWRGSRNVEGIPSCLQEERPPNVWNSQHGKPIGPSRTARQLVYMFIYHHRPILCMLHMLAGSSLRIPSPWTWGFTARNHKYQCLAIVFKPLQRRQTCSKNHPNQITSHHILGVSENCLYTCMYSCMYICI